MAFNDLNFWIAAFVAIVLFGGLSASALQPRGREGLGFLLGAVLGPVGLIIALILGARGRSDRRTDAPAQRTAGSRPPRSDQFPLLVQTPPAPLLIPPHATKSRTATAPRHFIDV